MGPGILTYSRDPWIKKKNHVPVSRTYRLDRRVPAPRRFVHNHRLGIRHPSLSRVRRDFRDHAPTSGAQISWRKRQRQFPPQFVLQRLHPREHAACVDDWRVGRSGRRNAIPPRRTAACVWPCRDGQHGDRNRSVLPRPTANTPRSLRHQLVPRPTRTMTVFETRCSAALWAARIRTCRDRDLMRSSISGRFRGWKQ